MMRRHSAVALIAISTIVGTGSYGVLARGAPRSVDSPTSSGTSSWVGESGKASYYGPAFDGHRSASGARFDQMALTAAHQWLPFGTKVKVILAGSSRSVIVTITDRIYSNRRIVDLSVAAARELGMIHCGIAEVVLAPA